jgi:uncharacterized protein YggU (UPF0235/DUF167 family)
VRAAPESGAANRALEALIAKAADVPRSAVTVVAGAAARVKVLRIAGEPDRLAQALGRTAL